MNTPHLFALALVIAGCQTTSHPTAPSTAGLGSTSPFEASIDVPGPVTVETIVSADWVVDRAGLINLDHPNAKAAHLEPGDEPIKLFFHAVRHPTRGLFLVDTGVERAFRDDPSHALLHGMTSKVARLDRMTTRTLTGDWIARERDPVRGVFLTHLHLDHVLGLRDVPSWAVVYVGPGDAEAHRAENAIASGIYDEALEGKERVREWTWRDGVVDVFGDGSFWAISVPGHTAGSTAYLARTPSGPVLLTGDACHTAWGWRNGVEPGTFSDDRPRSAKSLVFLEDLARRHPRMDVRLGHQEL